MRVAKRRFEEAVELGSLSQIVKYARLINGENALNDAEKRYIHSSPLGNDIFRKIAMDMESADIVKMHASIVFARLLYDNSFWKEKLYHDFPEYSFILDHISVNNSNLYIYLYFKFRSYLRFKWRQVFDTIKGEPIDNPHIDGGVQFDALEFAPGCTRDISVTVTILSINYTFNRTYDIDEFTKQFLCVERITWKYRAFIPILLPFQAILDLAHDSTHNFFSRVVLYRFVKDVKPYRKMLKLVLQSTERAAYVRQQILPDMRSHRDFSVYVKDPPFCFKLGNIMYKAKVDKKNKNK